MSLPSQERTIRACEACHKSKCKCINDGTAENPCTNCFKKGIPCVYKEAKKRGPRPGMMKALQDIVDELQSKLDDVTRRLEFSNKQLEILKGKSNNVQYHQSSANSSSSPINPSEAVPPSPTFASTASAYSATVPTSGEGHSSDYLPLAYSDPRVRPSFAPAYHPPLGSTYPSQPPHPYRVTHSPAPPSGSHYASNTSSDCSSPTPATPTGPPPTVTPPIQWKNVTQVLPLPSPNGPMTYRERMNEIATFEDEVRFIRMYFIFSNSVIPMMCKTIFWAIALRLSLIEDMINYHRYYQHYQQVFRVNSSSDTQTPQPQVTGNQNSTPMQGHVQAKNTLPPNPYNPCVTVANFRSPLYIFLRYRGGDPFRSSAEDTHGSHTNPMRDLQMQGPKLGQVEIGQGSSSATDHRAHGYGKKQTASTQDRNGHGEQEVFPRPWYFPNRYHDVLASVCGDKVPVCDHLGGDCSTLTFASIRQPDGSPLKLERYDSRAPVPRYYDEKQDQKGRNGQVYRSQGYNHTVPFSKFEVPATFVDFFPKAIAMHPSLQYSQNAPAHDLTSDAITARWGNALYFSVLDRLQRLLTAPLGTDDSGSDTSNDPSGRVNRAALRAQLADLTPPGTTPEGLQTIYGLLHYLIRPSVLPLFVRNYANAPDFSNFPKSLRVHPLPESFPPFNPGSFYEFPIPSNSAPRENYKATPEVIAAHYALLPPAFLHISRNTPKVLAACRATYCSVLAIGAKLSLNHEKAQRYMDIATEALKESFTEPSVEAILALTLMGYYHCGMHVGGSALIAKLYITLANEMSTGLDHSAYSTAIRAKGNTFSFPNTNHPSQDMFPQFQSMQGTSHSYDAFNPNAHDLNSNPNSAFYPRQDTSSSSDVALVPADMKPSSVLVPNARNASGLTSNVTSAIMPLESSTLMVANDREGSDFAYCVETRPLSTGEADSFAASNADSASGAGVCELTRLSVLVAAGTRVNLLQATKANPPAPVTKVEHQIRMPDQYHASLRPFYRSLYAVSVGIPLDILLSVRFLARITASYRYHIHETHGYEVFARKMDEHAGTFHLSKQLQTSDEATSTISYGTIAKPCNHSCSCLSNASSPDEIEDTQQLNTIDAYDSSSDPAESTSMSHASESQKSASMNEAETQIGAKKSILTSDHEDVPPVKRLKRNFGGSKATEKVASKAASGRNDLSNAANEQSYFLSNWDSFADNVEWSSPRGKISNIITYVTERTRRSVNTPDALRAFAPTLLLALEEAETIGDFHNPGAHLRFVTVAAINVSRAVVLHAVGTAHSSQPPNNRGAINRVSQIKKEMDVTTTSSVIGPGMNNQDVAKSDTSTTSTVADSPPMQENSAVEDSKEQREENSEVTSDKKDASKTTENSPVPESPAIQPALNDHKNHMLPKSIQNLLKYPLPFSWYFAECAFSSILSPYSHLAPYMGYSVLVQLIPIFLYHECFHRVHAILQFLEDSILVWPVARTLLEKAWRRVLFHFCDEVHLEKYSIPLEKVGKNVKTFVESLNETPHIIRDAFERMQKHFPLPINSYPAICPKSPSFMSIMHPSMFPHVHSTGHSAGSPIGHPIAHPSHPHHSSSVPRASSPLHPILRPSSNSTSPDSHPAGVSHMAHAPPTGHCTAHPYNMSSPFPHLPSSHCHSISNRTYPTASSLHPSSASTAAVSEFPHGHHPRDRSGSLSSYSQVGLDESPHCLQDPELHSPPHFFGEPLSAVSRSRSHSQLSHGSRIGTYSERKSSPEFPSTFNSHLSQNRNFSGFNQFNPPERSETILEALLSSLPSASLDPEESPSARGFADKGFFLSPLTASGSAPVAAFDPPEIAPSREFHVPQRDSPHQRGTSFVQQGSYSPMSLLQDKVENLPSVSHPNSSLGGKALQSYQVPVNAPNFPTYPIGSSKPSMMDQNSNRSIPHFPNGNTNYIHSRPSLFVDTALEWNSHNDRYENLSTPLSWQRTSGPNPPSPFNWNHS